jgi:subtilisin family serine protease
VVVAVVDTGVDYTHPDLDANIWTNPGEIAGDAIDNDGNGFIDDIRGWDFINNDNNPMDDDSHGTHVAGTIAAENNAIGNTGVAYNAKIMPVKVLGPNGGSSTAVAAGIRYAANNGAKVINLSLGGGSASTAMTEAIRYAVETKGATVVIASGNEGRTRPSFPASLTNTWGISVGAVDRNSRLASFSNRAGQQTVDYVVAPGVNVLSTTPNNTYSSYSGTSMATPHVAGVVALMLSANPTLTPAQIEQLVTQTANPAGVRV